MLILCFTLERLRQFSAIKSLQGTLHNIPQIKQSGFTIGCQTRDNKIDVRYAVTFIQDRAVGIMEERQTSDFPSVELEEKISKEMKEKNRFNEIVIVCFFPGLSFHQRRMLLKCNVAFLLFFKKKRVCQKVGKSLPEFLSHSHSTHISSLTFS